MQSGDGTRTAPKDRCRERAIFELWLGAEAGIAGPQVTRLRAGGIALTYRPPHGLVSLLGSVARLAQLSPIELFVREPSTTHRQAKHLGGRSEGMPDPQCQSRSLASIIRSSMSMAKCLWIPP